MGARTIKTSPDFFITDGKMTYYFPTDRDRRIAQLFMKKGKNLLFALAVDYPGLYKIPLCYRDAARAQIKELGIKTSRPKGYNDPRPFAMLFFLGPKKYRSTFGTSKADATSFKIWFCNFDKTLAEV